MLPGWHQWRWLSVRLFNGIFTSIAKPLWLIDTVPFWHTFLIMSDTPQITPPTHFNFDRTLWRRFITNAQPYWIPAEQSPWRFFGLLVVLLLLVITSTFFLYLGFSLGGRVVLPGFFTRVAGGLVDQASAFAASPLLPLAVGVFAFGSIVFVANQALLRGRWRQWGLLFLLLVLSFVVNGANVSISYIFRFIDTALNGRDQDTFWRFLFIYAGLIVSAIPILVLYRFTRLKLGLFWREWMTRLFLDRYFNHRAYYELDSNAANTEIDNPDQRITEDVRFFTGVTLTFLLDILDSILTLISFTAVLYSISKTLTLGLLVYAAFGTIVTILAGRRLIGINFNQLRLEANFRYSMVHVRDNAESIAFYRGESQEIQQVVDRLRQAIQNQDMLIIWQSLIDLFQYGYNYFTRIVPYVIVAPLYFADQTDFGTIAQATIAFSQVLGALSIVTNQIQSISSFAAGINRLGAFNEVLEDPALRYGEQQRHQIESLEAARIALRNVTLMTPNSEQTLVADLSLELETGHHLLIVGSSGCGKSSLLRAIAGLWTNGKGTISRPASDQMLFLPQKPYMLLGSLRDQLVYPGNRTDLQDEDLQRVLTQVNLGSLAERMGGFGVIQDWPNVLSLGEQQRLAFARILTNQAPYVILDEATSALDVANERLLYMQLRDLDVSYISVGHRPSLLAYHQMVLQLTEGTDWRLMTVDEYAATGFSAAG